MKVGNTTHNQWASKIINDIGEKEYYDLLSFSNEEITISPHYSKNADSLINPDKLLFPKTWNIMGDIDCSNNIDLNEEIKKLLDNSLMMVTALSPKIGYDAAAKIAKTAHKNGTTLKEEVMKSGLLNEKEYDKIMKPELMIKPR